MRYIFSLLLCLILQTGFSQNIIKTVGISYTNGTPTYTPAKAGSALALDTVTWRYYTWNGSTWLSDGFRVQTISGCSAPAYTPTKFQSLVVINACNDAQGGPEIYKWSGSVWEKSGGAEYTAGAGIAISGGNEISNTAPDQTVTMTDGTGIDVTGTYPDFTVTNTAPNVVQTLSIAGQDLTLSGGGGTVAIPGGGDYANIETLGAVGNGSTDNTAIIRAALLQSKIIYVPPGIFVCDSIVVPEGRTILGSGENSILLFKTGSTGRFVDCRNGNIALQNIVISGSESSTTYASTTTASNRIGVYLKGDNNDTKILNAWIRGFNAAGISGNGSGGNRERSPTISGCSILNCFIGINTNQGAAAGCEYLRIQNCNIGGCRIGVEVNSGNCIVSGNTISDNGYGVIVKDGGSGGNSGHGTISSNLINHSAITGAVFLTTLYGYSFSGNNVFFGGIDITGDGIIVSNNVLGFQSGDSLMLRNGNNCLFSKNYIATSFSYISSIGSNWVYADNRTVGSAWVGGLFNPVFNSSASYSTSTNTLTIPNIVSSSTLYNNAAAAANTTGYIRTSNAAASTTSLNPGLIVYQSGGTFPHGIDMGYSNSRYRTRLFTNNDISFAKTISAPTAQSDFTDIMTIRGDNLYVGIGTQSPAEKLDVVGNIKASGNLIAAGLSISGDVTFAGKVTARNFRQSAVSAASLTDYFRTSNNAISTTLLNPGLILYESGNNFAHGMDIGYSNSRFRTRIFTNNDISFAYAPGVVDDQTDFNDLMTIRGDQSRVGVMTQNPQRAFQVTGEVRITDLATDAPTRIVGADADGDLGEITLGPGFSTPSGVLTYTGIFNGNYTSTGTATTAFTVTLPTTQPDATYSVSIMPKNALSATGWYISARTTTTFTVTYLTGLTGAVDFDYIVVN